jgi:hypothetical protein
MEARAGLAVEEQHAAVAREHDVASAFGTHEMPIGDCAARRRVAEPVGTFRTIACRRSATATTRRYALRRRPRRRPGVAEHHRRTRRRRGPRLERH